MLGQDVLTQGDAIRCNNQLSRGCSTLDEQLKNPDVIQDITFSKEEKLYINSILYRFFM